MPLSRAVRRSVELRELLKGTALPGRARVHLGDGVVLPLETVARIVLSDLDDLLAACETGHVIDPDRWEWVNEEVRYVLALADSGYSAQAPEYPGKAGRPGP